MKAIFSNALIKQMGAGCCYEDLVGSNSAKNIIITIKKEFPWWGELHGWWCMNPTYNNTWSADVSRQDFAKHVVELFELWPNPLGGDPSFSSAEDSMRADVKTLSFTI
ncbi:hypothetical protein F5J12DRAFT_784823 [Pisolithus orientalis]|uniref:uncharacterized protein n=1 Tax=Pisolithus orientalis TaxID=936130 RepID=UPI002224D380|nr:uncharacterized protein F5J12DRAFT_784823 [Pisolithus orientalis]KAI5998981.1 hypothetical protein F5J12DRAFT_784823 [Pisolithus orientalis]